MGDAADVKCVADRVLNEIDKVVVGKRKQAQLLLAALAVSGHVLIEDVPGVGKTLLAKTFARVTGLSFRRIQFTPDLLPSDVTGLSVFNQKEGNFQWIPGPVFANIVLADELNRATPRTQSSLLEAMEERQVTTEGQTRSLPSPFMVVATQNPIEMEGTFPLPEAQMDRFLLSIDLGYPDKYEEAEILARFVDGEEQMKSAKETPLLNKEDLTLLCNAISMVRLSKDMSSYILSLVEATRDHKALALGVSPRGSLYLARLAKIYAALNGRDYVMPDDIKDLAVPCLAHRVIPQAETTLRETSAKDIILDLLDEVSVPIGLVGPNNG